MASEPQNSDDIRRVLQKLLEIEASHPEPPVERRLRRARRSLYTAYATSTGELRPNVLEDDELATLNQA